ncbi:major facilitator superfamily domain-containing protein [Triangularia setosa]|uniref:Major facilitator superfamily domain-containing protein n=1 Tax=Triangularia setosa TaxID=2587417 RepID=A0AAN6WFH6_9PEZI|nr:major facilitator superfamily domain-containing protein [Podospora setosa]
MSALHHHHYYRQANNNSSSSTTQSVEDEHADRGPAVLAVTAATLILASVFVAARMVSRIGIVRRFGADDYIMVLAWLITVFLSLSIIFGTKRGLGRHGDQVEEWEMPGLRMCEYVFSILYNPALMATKSSVLVFYLRLAKNTQKILRMASWGVLGVVNLAGVILTFMNIFQCHPIAAAWDINTPMIRCIPLLTEFICSAPINVTTDLAILALPIPVLTSMRLPPRQKVILILTFSLGIFVTIVDVVRIYYLQKAIDVTALTSSSNREAIYGQSPSFSWNASLSLMWSAVEVNVGITCACVPTLKPLIVRILPAMLYDPNATRRSTTLTGDEPSPFKNNNANNTAAEKENGVDGDGQPNPEGSPTEIGDPSPFQQTGPPAFVITPPEERSSEEISIRDFLAGAAGSGGPSSRRVSMAHSLNHVPPPHRDSAATATAVYFGFVNMKKPKSMLRTNATESFKYCTIVCILFFIWGFSYGLLNTLNNVIADVAGMSFAQTLGLTSMYFGGGYFFGPLLVGEWLLRHDEHRRSRKRERPGIEAVGGFKTTFIVGLLIYGTGTIMFWPGAVLTAYGGFMVSSFVVGFGLAVLETAANPFLILCGPPEYGDLRLLLAQGVQAVGSVLSGLLANKVFFRTLEQKDEADVRDESINQTLIDVQWTYLGVTLLSVLLALYFYYMPLPEVSDSELAELASKLPVEPKKRSLCGFKLRNWTIFFAALAQWCYVATQENMSVFFHQLLSSFVYPVSKRADYRPPGLQFSILNYLLIAHTAFALSRFVAAGVVYLSVKHPHVRLLPTPRTILTLSVFFSATFALIILLFPYTSNPNLIAIPLMLFFFCEGPIWPLVFSLGLRGQGARTKRAAAWLTMGASGPMFWPFVSYAIGQRGLSYQLAVGIPVLVLLGGGSLVYPVLLGVMRDGREMVDFVVRWEDGDGDDDQPSEDGKDGKGGEKEEGGFLGRLKGGLLRRGTVAGGTGERPEVEYCEESGRRGGGGNEQKEKEEETETSGMSSSKGSVMPAAAAAGGGGGRPEKPATAARSGTGSSAASIPPWERNIPGLDMTILKD